MRNLGRCISAVLAAPLGNPDSLQHQDFNMTSKCVGALVDFSVMTQYRSHTPDTHAYLKRYLQTFHQTKDIFWSFALQSRLVFVTGRGGAGFDP